MLTRMLQRVVVALYELGCLESNPIYAPKTNVEDVLLKRLDHEQRFVFDFLKLCPLWVGLEGFDFILIRNLGVDKGLPIVLRLAFVVYHELYIDLRGLLVDLTDPLLLILREQPVLGGCGTHGVAEDRRLEPLQVSDHC